MPAEFIARTSTFQTLTVANGATTSDACTATDWALFSMITPAALTSVACTFTVCNTLAGTYVPLYDSAGVIVPTTTISTSRAFDLPTQLASFLYFKVVLGSAEGAARSLVIMKKG